MRVLARISSIACQSGSSRLTLALARGLAALAVLSLLSAPRAALADPTPEQLAVCAAVERVAVETLAAAERSEPGATFAQASALFFQLADTAEGNPTAACPRADEHLVHAGVAARKAGDNASALRAFRAVRDHHGDSRLLPLALEHGAQLHQAVADYAGAIPLYEQLAERFPKERAAVDALHNAVLLRAALGDWDRADANAVLFEKNYGGTLPAETARLAYGLAALAAERRGASAPNAKLRDRRIDRALISARHGDRELRVQVLALAARRADERSDLDRVRRLAREIIDLTAAEASKPPPPDGFDRALGRLLTALGEAHFLLAKVDGAVPTTAAPATAQALPAWLDERRASLSRSEQSFRLILEIKPVPPPKWVVAAHGEIAVAWTRLHDELEGRAAELEKRGKGVDAQAFRGAAAVAAERARSAAEAYLAVRAKMQHASRHAVEVESWLSRVFPDRLVPLTELVPAPRWQAEGTVGPARDVPLTRRDGAP